MVILSSGCRSNSKATTESISGRLDGQDSVVVAHTVTITLSSAFRSLNFSQDQAYSVSHMLISDVSRTASKVSPPSVLTRSALGIVGFRNFIRADEDICRISPEDRTSSSLL